MDSNIKIIYMIKKTVDPDDKIRYLPVMAFLLKKQTKVKEDGLKKDKYTVLPFFRDENYQIHKEKKEYTVDKVYFSREKCINASIKKNQQANQESILGI